MKMSNIGWNVPGGAGGADQRPLHPTVPPLPASHQTSADAASSTTSYATDAPPPSYESLYPNSTSMPPQCPGHPSVATVTPTSRDSFNSNSCPHVQNIRSQSQKKPPKHKVQTSHRLWLPASDGEVPPGAVIGGRDISGEILYIARAKYGGALTPGKLVPSHRCCYVSWDGREHSLKCYEVLCNCPGKWISSSRGSFPQQALPGGISESGETLYIGRTSHKNSLTIGKVQPSHKLCYIPFAGKEIGYKSYEVFVPN